MAAFATKRAPRCPLPKWGWLFLREGDLEALERGAPQQQHPDHRCSGPNPAWVEHCAERLQTIARDPHYSPQLTAQIELLDKRLQVTLAALAAAADELDKIEAERAQVLSLLPLEPQP